jgi:hypothetical protein
MSSSSPPSTPARRNADATSPRDRLALIGPRSASGTANLLLALAAVLGFGIAACSHRPPIDYARSRAAAERAYAAGRYEEAAHSWLEAAERARSPRDATEARYRAATSWERAGKPEAASELYGQLAADPASERSARAAFDQAELRLATGDQAAGLALVDDAIRRYPDSGVARRALERRLIDLNQQHGANAALAYLAEMDSSLANTELAEAVAYQRARYQELAGAKRAARDSYLAVARRFPYPFGAYWDDALYHAAELDVELGNPRHAIGHLERMLSQREPTPVHGSLERPRYGPARFLMAEIYRDQLGDPNAARNTFLVLVNEHPTSPLRDDALWEAALLALAAGNGADACADLGRLVEEMGDSRYVPCAHRVCPQLPSIGHCRGYIAERIPTTP